MNVTAGVVAMATPCGAKAASEPFPRGDPPAPIPGEPVRFNNRAGRAHRPLAVTVNHRHRRADMFLGVLTGMLVTLAVALAYVVVTG